MLNIQQDSVIDIRSEADYQNAKDVLSSKSYPEQLLRKLMQSLENYRGSRKIGWSRPWNKYGVNTIQSYKLRTEDQVLHRQACALIERECTRMPEAARSFVEEFLLRKMPPMGFVFLSDIEDGKDLYEVAVISYGRVNADNRRFRDRLDVLLESKIENGRSMGLSRMRIFVDPYLKGRMEPLWSQTIDSPASEAGAELFAYVAGLAEDWANDRSRIWKHWITEYIDYFGPRRRQLEHSYFEAGTHAGRVIDDVGTAVS
jgi:hypothetical protein